MVISPLQKALKPYISRKKSGLYMLNYKGVKLGILENNGFFTRYAFATNISNNNTNLFPHRIQFIINDFSFALSPYVN